MLLYALAACTTIEPTPGTYIGEVAGFTASDACEEVWGVDVASLEQANATDVAIADDGESMTLDQTLECSLFDTAFTCLHADEDHVPEAAVEFRIIVEGEWIASYAFDSDWEVLATCTGSECGALAESCEIRWSFDPALFE